MLLASLWFLALVALTIRYWVQPDTVDLSVYAAGARSLLAGQDPYADAMALQQAFHLRFGHPVSGPVPLSYVYAPITLPLLRLLGGLPPWLTAGLYGTAYCAGLFAQLWASLEACAPGEWRCCLYLTPLAAFFPALLVSDTVWSGNVAFILYGVVLAAALPGWRRGMWLCFYAAVLLASCVKPPLLTLLAIPVFSARRQWLPAVATAILGLAVFALQAFLWPTLFHHFLQAVELQFSYDRDFGLSPAGLLGGVLFDRGLPYSPTVHLFYLAYATPILIVLYSLSRRFHRAEFCLQQWLPVLLTGVLLLNPRIMEYDEVFLAIPAALILWRLFQAFLPGHQALYASVAFVGIANLAALQPWNAKKLLDTPLLVLLFSAGTWTLPHRSPRTCGVETDPAFAAVFARRKRPELGETIA